MERDFNVLREHPPCICYLTAAFFMGFNDAQVLVGIHLSMQIPRREAARRV
jgi:hypothetical protein